MYIAPELRRHVSPAEESHASDRPPLPAGLAATKRLSETFVPAARFYELNAFNRTLKGSNQASASFLKAVGRGVPIIGERAGAFAGFLGRPFREYDFIAGVYDGLYWVAVNLLEGEQQTEEWRRANLVLLIEHLRHRQSSPSHGGITDYSYRVIRMISEADYGKAYPHPLDSVSQPGEIHKVRVDLVSRIIDRLQLQEDGHHDECSGQYSSTFILDWLCEDGAGGVNASSASWMDYDQHGDLDLYSLTYAVPSNRNDVEP